MGHLVRFASIVALGMALSGAAFAATDAAPPDPADLTTSPSAGNEATPASPDAKEPASATPAIQAAPNLPPEDVAVSERLRDLIEHKLGQSVPRERDRAGVRAFYESRAFAPLWISRNAPLPRAQETIAFLREVEADGLNPADYPMPAFTDNAPDRLAADELKLTNAVITFARHAATGRVAFTRASGSVYFDLKFPDPSDVLAGIAASTDIPGTLDAYNPQHPAYKALKAEFAAERRREAADHQRTGSVERTADVRPPATRRGKRPKVAAKHQHEPRVSRLDTIIANMERWRWMPHQLAASYVMVNVPDYTLTVADRGKTAWTTRIVVGKPGKYATPLLTETMKYITVNPTWNVPPSIIRNEYLPVLQRDPGALARVGLRVGHNKDGSLRIYQPPGERNALGRIRFNFPNRFLVYQHDTPDKHLFAKATRAYSHGCMRVQNPDQYAEVLLSISQPEDGYTAKRIRSLYGSGERGIMLKHPIPVYITYQTAFVDEDGKLQIRPDIYGLDKDIAALLHEERGIADVPIARNYSTGSKPVMASVPQAAREDYFSDRPFAWSPEPGSAHNGPWRFDRFRPW